MFLLIFYIRTSTKNHQETMEKPKNLCLLLVTVTCCMTFCIANDAESDEESGRALSLAAANHPAGNFEYSYDMKSSYDFQHNLTYNKFLKMKNVFTIF